MFYNYETVAKLNLHELAPKLVCTCIFLFESTTTLNFVQILYFYIQIFLKL